MHRQTAMRDQRWFAASVVARLWLCSALVCILSAMAVDTMAHTRSLHHAPAEGHPVPSHGGIERELTTGEADAQRLDSRLRGNDEWAMAADVRARPDVTPPLDDQPHDQPRSAELDSETARESSRAPMRATSARLAQRPSASGTYSRGAGGVIWYVDHARVLGNNDGTSWDDAFQGALGVQAALAVASAGDEIWVAAGTYLPDDAGDRQASFVLIDAVQMYGGFLGDETERAQRDPAANPTILSGDLNGDDEPGFVNVNENSLRVVVADGVTSATTLDGFTIRSAHASLGEDSYLPGGGLRCLAASLQVINCRFLSNTAQRGGAVLVQGGEPTFTDCEFAGNRALPDETLGEGNGGAVSVTAESHATFIQCAFTSNQARIGGAVHIVDAAATVQQCTFESNSAVIDTDFLGGLGGAVFINSELAIAFSQCAFTGNTARQGGAVNMDASQPSFDDCTFTSNIAQTDALLGGGLGGAATISFGSTPMFVDCDFLSNAARVGGGVHVFQSEPVFEQCVFNDNAAARHATLGGGFGGAANLLNQAHAAFTDCTFSTNTARQGGAAQIETSQPIFSGCTFSFNTAPLSATFGPGFGGAILCINAGDALIDDATLLGNTATFGGAMYVFNAQPTVQFSTFNLNGAETSGGALYVQACEQPRVLDCAFTSNIADSGSGGAIVSENCDPRVRRSDFTSNSASNVGGALSLTNNAQADVRDCTFTQNQAFNGGAVRITTSPATIASCTMLNNEATSAGGGIDVRDAPDAQLHSIIIARNQAAFGGGVHVFEAGPALVNATIVNNTAANGAGVRISGEGSAAITNSIVRSNVGAQIQVGAGSSVTGTFSNVQGGFSGAGNIDLDPLFVNAAADDYTLQSASPCIEAGSNAAVSACAADRALHHRIAAGSSGRGGGGEAIVDMGAFEFDAEPIIDCDDNGRHDPCEIELGLAADCNNNGIPDACDIASGFSLDDEGDGVPDECQRIAGDVNGDGIVNVQDLLIIISNWGGCPQGCAEPCPADINFDCVVNVQDLLLVIANWGSASP